MLNLRMKSRAEFWKLGAVLLVVVWSLNGCGDRGGPVEVAEEGRGSEVSFAIRLSKLAQSLLARAEVVITAGDMAAMQQELTISGDLVSGTVKGIPAGSGRLFTLNGYDGNGALAYSGSSQVDLPAGEVVPVRITMRRVTGPGPELTVTLSGTQFYVKDATIEFVWIEPGTFTMGSPNYEEEREGDEGPPHEVTISKGFYLGKYEVTQEQWYAVMGTKPWEGQDYVQSGLKNPAVYISWEEVQPFVGKLNAYEGEAVYRLPSEAEWEYACRAGTETRWSFGDEESQLGEYAWYEGNAWNAGQEYAHQVGLKKANPWGLYDMHGNVWEWCQDWYGESYYSSSPKVDPAGPGSGSERVVRGGSFYFDAQRARSANRDILSPGNRSIYLGVRLLRTEGQ